MLELIYLTKLDRKSLKYVFLEDDLLLYIELYN